MRIFSLNEAPPFGTCCLRPPYVSETGKDEPSDPILSAAGAAHGSAGCSQDADPQRAAKRRRTERTTIVAAATTVGSRPGTGASTTAAAAVLESTEKPPAGMPKTSETTVCLSEAADSIRYPKRQRKASAAAMAVTAAAAAAQAAAAKAAATQARKRPLKVRQQADPFLTAGSCIPR